MAIFRGIGGAGDSTTDATVTAVTEQAVNAANSATSAATSASNAASSAANAATSASNAASSATNAANEASDAAASATSATASKDSATASAADALASQTAAATSATNAATSATNAATSATTATTKASEVVSSATAAAASATTATTKANEAATSASNAATSATNAATSETNAATSETNAASSASTASTNASNAATSATNAASSASTASTAATNAAASASAALTSETNAAASETAAGASETAAAASATSAAGSATTATTKATEAASSASSAASSATASATSASAASTSETNAASSATNALTSENNAASSATSASGSASSASTSATNAATSESNASTSETNAATSASNAATSETNASNSASAAATSASNSATSATSAASSASSASTSATNAASSATDAASSAASAAASYDSFDDRYLGPKTSAPTTDNDGNTLLTGALYFDTSGDIMKVYTGSSWVAAYASSGGALINSNNLSDVSSVSSSRTNLGLGTTSNVVFNSLETTDGLTVGGNLTVNGTLTTIDTTNLAVSDNMIYLNDGSTVTNPDLGWAGNYNDGTYAHAGVFRDATDGKFKFYDGYTPEPGVEINTGDASFSLADVQAGTFFGALSGNASTATALATSRTIGLTGDVSGSVSFNGTADATITAVVADDSHNHIISNVDGLQTALDAKAPLASPGLTGTPTAPTAAVGTNTTQVATTAFVNAEIANDAPTKTGSGASGTWGISITGNAATATSATSASSVPYSGLTGVVPTWNQSTTGNAATATQLATARTIGLSGDVSGSVSFDGSANATITAVVADDSHNHVISNVDGLQTALDGKAPLASPSFTGTPAAPTAAVGTNTTQVATTAFVNAEIANDAPTKTGSGASGTWGISVTGNAATATTLQTARTINGVSFNGSANITVEPYVENAVTTSATRYVTFVDNSTAGYKRLNEDANFTYNPGTNVLSVPTFSGALSGNATTATTLQTARTINGVSFNGSSNITITAAANGGNADTTDGYHVSTTRNAANTIPVRDANGYLQLGWINTTSGATTSTVNKIYASADDYLRYVTPATFRSQIIDGYYLPLSGGTTTGTISAPTFNATSTTSGGFQGIDADSAASPSFTWSADLNTGMYRATTDRIGFTAGGNNEFLIYTSYTYSPGSSRAPIFYDSNNTAYYADLSSTGTSINAAGSIVAASDIRLKDNIETIQNALDKTLKLRGVTYTRKDGDNKTKQVGVIAQEVKEVLPEAVVDGAHLSVAYGNMVGLLIEAIKEQQKQIDELKQFIKE